MNARRVDLIAGACITLAGLATLFYVIPNHVAEGYGYGLSPRAFPYICATAITVLGCILFVSRLRQAMDDGSTVAISRSAMLRLVVILGGTALALVLMRTIGYIAAGALLVAFLMVLMGERRLIRVVPVALLWTLFLWALFEKLLGAPIG